MRDYISPGDRRTPIYRFYSLTRATLSLSRATLAKNLPVVSLQEVLEGCVHYPEAVTAKDWKRPALPLDRHSIPSIRPTASGAHAPASWLRYNESVAHGLSDTDSDTARVHLELLRRASPAARLRLALSLTRTTLSLSRATLAKNLPGVSPQEVGLRFVARLYGQPLADEIRADLIARTR